MDGDRGEGAVEERQRRVLDLLARALEREPGERVAFLAQACGGDQELAAEVVGLLRGETGGFLEPPDEEGYEGLDDGAPAEGARLGPYALEREIGAGGMGRVWLARRVDGAFEKSVAIKLIRRGMDTEEVLERFRHERQVLADLDHPGIARLIDGGATDTGRPWLVMEHVEGRPIDRWCDEQELPARARLELFRRVCEAVQHAHRNLVVHRDIKPSNVLVGHGGEPKLLDFGIAKVLDPGRGVEGVEITQAGRRFLTPAYASPEQLRGRPVTTSSDVYSLGVLLYRLLTGRLPHRLEGCTGEEIERIVCSTDPDRPSTVVVRARETEEGATRTPEELSRRRGTTPRGLQRTLVGDLDRILMMALRREPERRYASVEQLSEDVRRHLEGLPVLARDDSATYRAAKFVARHRVSLAATLAVFLSLVAALLWSLRESRRARAAGARELQQRELAEDRLEEVERLAADLELERTVALEQKELAEQRAAEVRRFATTLAIEVSGAMANLQGATEAKELVLTLGLEHLDRLAAGVSEDPALMRELAEAYRRFGQVQGDPTAASLGSSAAALESIARSVEICERLVALDGQNASNVALLAHALLVQGDVLRFTRGLESCREPYARAHALMAPLVDRADLTPVGRLVLAMTLARRGEMLATDGDTRAALDVMERAAEILRELEEGDGPLTDRSGLLAQVLGGQGLAHLNAGDAEAALRSTREAIDVQGERVERDPNDAEGRRMLSTFRWQLGEVELAAGRAREAVEMLEPLCDEQRSVLAIGDPGPRVRADLTALLDTLARARLQLGDRWIARDLFREETDHLAVLSNGDPDNDWFRERHVHALLRIADLETRLGHEEQRRDLLDSAVEDLARAGEHLEAMLPRRWPDPTFRATVLVHRAQQGQLCLVRASVASSPREDRLAEARAARDWFAQALEEGERARGEGLPTPVEDQREADLREDLEDAERLIAENTVPTPPP